MWVRCERWYRCSDLCQITTWFSWLHFPVLVVKPLLPIHFLWKLFHLVCIFKCNMLVQQTDAVFLGCSYESRRLLHCPHLQSYNLADDGTIFLCWQNRMHAWDHILLRMYVKTVRKPSKVKCRTNMSRQLNLQKQKLKTLTRRKYFCLQCEKRTPHGGNGHSNWVTLCIKALTFLRSVRTSAICSDHILVCFP